MIVRGVILVVIEGQKLLIHGRDTQNVQSLLVVEKHSFLQQSIQLDCNDDVQANIILVFRSYSRREALQTLRKITIPGKMCVLRFELRAIKISKGFGKHKRESGTRKNWYYLSPHLLKSTSLVYLAPSVPTMATYPFTIIKLKFRSDLSMPIWDGRC